MKLKNKRYLITGASSGLGFALVKRLVKIEGTKITGVARNIKKLEKAPHNKVFPLSLDITKPENIDIMLDQSIKMMGDIDCLIACAGFGYYESLYGKDYEHIERIFQTNVLSPIYTLSSYLEKSSEEVSFVAISSMLGKFGLPGMSLYSATKYALDGFQDSYRFEKPQRLHYMTVYPIGLKTHFWERIATDIPLPRPLQSADKAACAILDGLQSDKRVVYTATPAAVSLCVNQVIPILIPAYQFINKLRFDKWLKKH